MLDGLTKGHRRRKMYSKTDVGGAIVGLIMMLAAIPLGALVIYLEAYFGVKIVTALLDYEFWTAYIWSMLFITMALIARGFISLASRIGE